jgi:hypothetical protein
MTEHAVRAHKHADGKRYYYLIPRSGRPTRVGQTPTGVSLVAQQLCGTDIHVYAYRHT